MKEFEIARSRGWLSAQPREFQDELLSRSFIKRFAKKETICRSGDPSSGIIALLSGVLWLEHEVKESVKIPFVKIPVSWFGLEECLNKSSLKFTLTARTASVLLFLPRDDFGELIKSSDNCKAFVHLAVNQSHDAQERLASFIVNDVEAKVARCLAHLASVSTDMECLTLPVTQYDLAELCGLSRPTVVSVLGKFAKRGLIQCQYRKLTILKPEALRSVDQSSGSRPHDMSPVSRFRDGVAP